MLSVILEIGMFKQLFPSATAGSGRVVPNNSRDGRGQGRASAKRKAHCRHCGFPNDIKKIATNSGTMSGDGARGTITKYSETGTLLGGGTFTDTYGDAALRKGAGCAFCHSPNSTK